MALIAKNNRDYDLILEDLYGFTLPALASVDLTAQFAKEDIAGSEDLKNYVADGSITLNDGTQDLDVQNALFSIQLSTEYYSNLSRECAFIIDPYIRYHKKYWTVVCRFLYDGTDSWVPSACDLIIEKEEDVFAGYVRLYDVTNHNVIFTLYIPKQEIENPTLFTVTNLQNLPQTTSIMELQARMQYTTKHKKHGLRFHYFRMRSD